MKEEGREGSRQGREGEKVRMKQIAYEYSERERQRGGGREKGWEGGGGETRVDSQLAGFSSLPQGGRPGRLSK